MRTTRPHLRSLLERALAAYIRTFKVEGSPLLDSAAEAIPPGETEPILAAIDVPIAISPGKLGENGEIPAEWGNLEPPLVIVSASTSKPAEAGFDLHTVSVQIALLTSGAESTAPQRHAARFALLCEIFGELAFPDIIAALNPPEEGEDSRLVQGIRLWDIEFTGEQGSDDSSYITDALSLEITCSAETSAGEEDEG